MFSVNFLAYALSSLITVVSAVYLYITHIRDPYRRVCAQNNVEFRSLQKLFIPPYLLALFAESLQAPYLYILYHSYRYIASQIAALYVVGMISNVFFTFFVVRFLAVYGRRALCLACLGAGVLACALKFIDSFVLLFVGRILDGLAAALITAPFQQWYTHVHVIQYDFPIEWVSSTFHLVATGASFLSVFAGWSAEALEGITHITVFPFAVASIVLIGSGVFIGFRWSENKNADEFQPLAKSVTRAMGVFKTKPLVLVLCVITCFVEAAIQIFVFIWAPIFLKAKFHEDGTLSYGVIYASLMASSLLGSLVFASENTKKIPLSRLMSIAVFIGFCVMWRVYANLPNNSLEWKSVEFVRIFLYFCIFELTIGIYTPAVNLLQSEILPAAHRASLLAIVRIPLMTMSAASIIYLHPMTDGQRSIVATAAGLLLMASFLSILLDIVLTRRGKNVAKVDPDRFLLPRQSAQPAVHQTPSRELQ